MEVPCYYKKIKKRYYLVFFVQYLLNCIALSEESCSAETKLMPEGIANGSDPNIKFTCQVSEVELNSYKWFLNGSLLENKEFIWIPVPPFPGGIVQCGYDDCSEPLSNPVSFIVPPSIESELLNKTVDFGDNVTFKCEVQGYPFPNVAWYIDDEIVGTGSELVGPTTVSGKYICLAHNDAGYTTSAAWIHVIGGPSVVSSSQTSSTGTTEFATVSSESSSSSFRQHVTTESPKPSPGEDSGDKNDGYSTSVIIILGIVVPLVSVIIITMLFLLYWCRELGNMRKKSSKKELPSSTSYVNTNFQEDAESNDEDDEMKVELFATEKQEDKVVFSAHVYKIQNTNLYGSDSEKKPKDISPSTQHTMVDVSPMDIEGLFATETNGPSLEPHDNVNRVVDEDTKSHNEHESEEQSVIEGVMVAVKTEENSLTSSRDNTDEPLIIEENDARQTHDPNWLKEMRSQDNFKSHVLLIPELVDLVHKLDLLPVGKVKTHPLQREFKSVPFDLPLLSEWPSEVMSKNRYRDVLPNPETAVTLSDTGEPVSTYINANFIKGYDGYEKTYISAQAPIYDTVPDFWRMIWEHKVDTIVMLTGLFEGGKNKCASYWPTTQGCDTQSYGKFVVQNVHEEQYDNYKITFLSVHCKEHPEQERDVYHFCFLGWPDFGVPNNGFGMIQLRNAVESIRNPQSTLLVHCSAGLGRSGTYIGTDIALHQYEAEKVVDPLLILQLLRKDRGGMIQTLDQYEFLHRVLAHHVLQTM